MSSSLSSCIDSIPMPIVVLGVSSQLGERGASSGLNGLLVRGDIEPRSGLGDRLPELGCESNGRGRLGFGNECALAISGALNAAAPVLLDRR